MASINHQVRAQDFGTLAAKSSPENWLGPYFLSVGVESIFLGTLCNQVWVYYSSFPKDPVWLKQSIGAVLGLSILKTIQSCCTAWFRIIMSFPSWEGAAHSGWAACTAPVLIGMISSAAQIFFIWRCYALTGRNRYFLAVLVGALLTQLAMSAGLSAQLSINEYDIPAVERLATPWHVSAVVLDFAITFVVSYKLVRSRRGDNLNTDTILTKLLMVTWESALPPAMSEVTGLVVHSLTVDRQPKWNYMTNSITPRLYAFSLMYCLNSRLEIRRFSLAMATSDYTGRVPTKAVETSEVRFRNHQSDSRILP